MQKKNIHIVRRENRWAVLQEKQSAPESTHKKQSTAINIGKQIAKGKELELIIHGRDGKIRDKDSYGPDPNPPKDMRH